MNKIFKLFFVLLVLQIRPITIQAQQGIIPTMGKEFWVGFMENLDQSSGSLDLFISSYVNTSGTVVQPLTGYTQSFTVLANTVTTVTLPIDQTHFGSEVIDNKAFLVQTLDTVSVYALNFQTATADAAAILPIEALGTDYRVHCYSGIEGFAYSEFLIVATQDGTQVEITPSATTTGGQAAGVPFIIDLDSAASYQVKAAASSADLTGSTIIGTAQSGACRPFAVFSGSQCTNIPVGCFACDHIFEQNLATPGWGRKFFLVPWTGPDSYTYRVMANTNGTTFTVNGVAQAPLNAGQYSEVNQETNALIVQSASPISVAQFIQGQDCSGNVGDPALLILNAEEQMISNVSFATVVSASIDAQYVSVIVNSASIGNVVLNGANVPPTAFTPFATDPGHSYGTFPLTQGSHSISCPSGLTAYVYGVGSNYETYAYSAGSFSPLPPILVDSVLCGVDSTGQLTLAPPEVFNNPWWSLSSAPEDTLHLGLTYTFAPPGSDVYVVTGNDLVSSCVQEYFFSVEVDDPPVLTVTAGDDLVCAYEEVQLNVSVEPAGTYLYNWWPDTPLNNGALPNPVATPAQSGWYYVSVSSLNGCSVSVDSVFVTVSPGNILQNIASVDDPAICAGDTVQLNVDVLQILVSDTFDISPSLTMWAGITGGTVSAICGAVGGNALHFDGPAPLREARTGDVNVVPGGIVRTNIKISTGTAPCDNTEPGDDVLLQYSINAGTTWVTFNTFLESQFADWTQVDVAIPPPALTTATRFRWVQPIFSGAGTDNWQLDNCAIASENLNGVNVTWSPTNNLASSTASATAAWPIVTGWYQATTTDQSTNCTYADSVLITVDESFTIIMTSDTAVCDVQGIALSAIPSAGNDHDYVWSPNTNISSIFAPTPTVTPASTTTYSVTVTSANGCTATDEVEIVVAATIDLTVTTTDDDICVGDVITLNADVSGATGLEFEWSPGTGLNDNGIQSPTAQPLLDVWYAVVATDTASGCVLTDSTFINVTTTGVISAGNDTTVCSTAGLQLNVVHNLVNPTIQWTPANYLINEDTATPTVTHDSTMTYVVRVSEGVNCPALDTILVTLVFEGLTLSTDSSLCAGDEILIDAGYAGADYSWSTGATTQTITVIEAGSYICSLSDPLLGCSVELTTNVTVDALPVFEFGPDTSLCIGQSWIMDPGLGAGLDYTWNTGSTATTLTTSTNGSFGLTIEDLNACIYSDSIQVSFDQLPVVVLTDTIVCTSETISLDAGNPGSTYIWSPTGATTRTIAVNANSGTYGVVVTTPTFCTDSAQAELTFIPFPIVDLGTDTALCDTESLLLDAGNDTCTFIWNTGSTNQTITLFASQPVFVDVFNDYCTTRDSINVVFDPLPNALSIDVITTCLDVPPKQVELSGENPGNTYLWEPGGDSTQVILVSSYGWYVVHLTTPFNCNLSDSILVQEYCNSALYMPNSFTPDGDGYNDLFAPNGWNLASTELSIFDRWGQVVHTGSGTNAEWDGTIAGTPAKTDVYIWKLSYQFYENVEKTERSATFEKTGHVTVLR